MKSDKMTMQSVFQSSKWIWCAACDGVDTYAEFLDSFDAPEGEVILRVSVDSDYTLFVNGVYAASNQYGDFEHYKIYDTVNITRFLKQGKNELKLLVYHCGVNTQRYKKAAAGLIYEVIGEAGVLCCSDADTLSRKSPTYISGQKRIVSPQLGFTFTYDATKANDGGYAPSVCVSKKTVFYPRPVQKQKVLERHPVQSIQMLDPQTYLIDLGEETVGLATLDFWSDDEQTIRVAYGESLDNGRVRTQIGIRNFFFEYRAKAGKNQFTDYMLRLGGRYLEVTAELPIKIDYIGILPQVYEIGEKPYLIEREQDRRIYDACVNTLRLCMMEHYVDTPWREQCLYAFDSRNQMLCGYYAFLNGNRDYARANLALLGEDRREDGLLSICSPCGTALAIPSFSLYYILAMKEYLHYTKDSSLVCRYFGRIEAILDAFLREYSEEEGLIVSRSGENLWNFYDWSSYLDDPKHQRGVSRPDLILNALFVMALDAYAEMCQAAGLSFRYEGRAEAIRRAMRIAFFDECGLFSFHRNSGEYTVMGNALAILCGAAEGDLAKTICDRIVSDEATPSSLSANIWKYEALLQTDSEKYKNCILNEIRTNYQKMLDAGSTTVWETLEGSSAFHNAGSLCHGWSAVPVYIFHRLGIAVPKDQ
ncbi:MAG: family 78 glycoside hydrolase catalytic domain [Clostridia bacterium]|nr:family 78 glycoside hydrolase catalytic domain [Clostridia bacterium]